MATQIVMDPDRVASVRALPAVVAELQVLAATLQAGLCEAAGAQHLARSTVAALRLRDEVRASLAVLVAGVELLARALEAAPVSYAAVDGAAMRAHR